MQIEKKPSGTAKAGLTTGIIGTSLGALNLMGNAGSLLGGVLGGRTACVANVGCGCGCSEDHLVDRYTLGLVQENAKLKTDVALRDATEFTQQQQLEMYKYVDGRMRDIERQICAQEVVNQKTADSIQIVNERLQCCCESMDSKLAAEAAARKCADERLEEKICCETKERKCADNSIVNYVNSTFYPKQVGTVSTTTPNTAQILYNPLPTTGNSCCC